LKTAEARAMQLFSFKELLSTRSKKRNFGGIKFHALSHHAAEQIYMFGTSLFTDTDQFERQHNIDGVSAYNRSSKRGSSMPEEMLTTSMTNNLIKRLQLRADAETMHMITKTRPVKEVQMFKRLLLRRKLSESVENIVEDGFITISNYRSIALKFDSDLSKVKTIDGSSIWHYMITDDDITYALEKYIAECGDESLQEMLRNFKRG
jgi:hypothetical protein